MKKKLLLMMPFLMIAGMVSAENSLSVNDFTLPQSGGSILVNINLDEANYYNSYGFEVVTPTGFSYSVNSEDLVPCELGGHTGNLAAYFDDSGRVLKVNFMQSSGFQNQVLSLQIPLEATTEEVGTIREFTIKDIFFITTSFTKVYLNDVVTFKVTIGEPADSRTLLDENSSTAPEASNGAVDVRVRRTIAAGNWSTICLPFAMTSEQVTTAFGTGVQLADFTGVDTTVDGEDNIVGLTVKFSDVTAIEANHPYIIKVTSPVTEFTVDDVEVNPDVASVDKDEFRLGSGKPKDPYRYIYNSFIGTYVAQTELAAMTLFLNNNKFYYSTGLTKMNGYRAYFDFYDVLTEVEEADVKMFVNVNGEETRIENLNVNDNLNNTIYDLSGRRVNKTQHGVYIVNGKKVLK